MNEQRRLDLACMSDEDLQQLANRTAFAVRNARDVGTLPDPELVSLDVQITIERALRVQESEDCLKPQGEQR